MSHSPDDYLGHILIETSFILEMSEGVERKSFLENQTLTRAMVRSLEIIGEATKKLSDDFRKQHPQIPWKQMAGMRDIVIPIKIKTVEKSVRSCALALLRTKVQQQTKNFCLIFIWNYYKLIHEYFGVDYNVVWDVVINQIPLLHKEIQAILNQQ